MYEYINKSAKVLLNISEIIIVTKLLFIEKFSLLWY